jgi:acetoin utilization deacetylase AcuC-like enzyme
MEKFALLLQHLQRSGIAKASNTFRPGRAKNSLLELAHCPDYIERFTSNTMSPKEARRMGLPWSEALVKRSLISPAGTLLAAHFALKHGVACHLAGGTHHAHYDYASGYCVFNDLAITANALIKTQKAQRVLIFDCDVHQGDGTARILANNHQVFTCSIHCEKNFPVRKAHSDLDVNIAKGTSDDAYLLQVEKALEQAIHDSQPDIILYDAGVDVYENDPLGLLNISLAGIRERDYLVLNNCHSRGIAVATVIGGGYDDDRAALSLRHAIGVEAAHDIYS